MWYEEIFINNITRAYDKALAEKQQALHKVEELEEENLAMHSFLMELRDIIHSTGIPTTFEGSGFPRDTRDCLQDLINCRINSNFANYMLTELSLVREALSVILVKQVPDCGTRCKCAAHSYSPSADKLQHNSNCVIYKIDEMLDVILRSS